MPRPKNNSYVIFGSKADPNRDVDKVIKATKPKISHSVLSVTLGERLRRREGDMPNIRGDRPEPHYSDG
jgi:hypothetical protein